MSDVRCENGPDWTHKIVEHGVATGHSNFAWDDTVGSAFGMRCLDCDVRFVLGSWDLKNDSRPQAQILYHGLRTQGGRETMLATVRRTVEQSRKPKNAWDRVLADDDD